MNDAAPKRDAGASTKLHSGPDVTLYSRGGCPVWEDSNSPLTPLMREFRATLREIDIEGDATLMERFGCDIPVIYIGRKKAAKHRVNLEQFRRQLADAS